MLFDVYLSEDPDIKLLLSDNDFKIFALKKLVIVGEYES